MTEQPPEADDEAAEPRHRIRYRREKGYGSRWMTICYCGWNSRPYEEFRPAQSAGREHKELQADVVQE